MRRRVVHTSCAIMFFFCACTVSQARSATAAARPIGIDVFAQLTQHIKRQADTDKEAFAIASQCMNFFYKQQRHKPAPPAVQQIAWIPAESSELAAADSDAQEADCRKRYPEGLDAVRTDFQRTQALLSLSLTFYEFALVGDGDDNSLYNARELHDILVALNLSAEPSLGAAAHLRSLTAHFDSLHEARGMEALMAGMGKLYDQGYRVTTADKAHLNRVME
ncbi:MAG TPA: hypothetical protein PLY42_15535 [Nitrospira sp.]|nr:hypothetical protein [Nitrospira sp.]HMX92785.1 hypothetical protein [Nitrospira sp.]HNA84529.1 hypothetical protein [Nitrospira sp.]HNG00510.1 hypothetical protein [Nitrospira sp.]HNJ19779.1 hypothetical protein [Nitrospira sp.]